MSQLQFDADTARRIEALYQIRDAVHRRELVREALGAARGTESSTLAVGLASTVSSSRRSLVRPAPSWAWTAAPRCFSLRAPAALVATMSGSSKERPALPVESGTFDGAVCVQVLEYVADVDAALAELHRALRPGGRAVVWDVDWATVSIHSRDTVLTEARAASLGRAPR